MNDICKILVNKNGKLKNPDSPVNIVHISNIVKAILFAIKFQFKGIYNLVMGHSVKSSDLLEIIKNHINFRDFNKVDYQYELLSDTYDTYDAEYYLDWDNKLPINQILNHIKKYKELLI